MENEETADTFISEKAKKPLLICFYL